MTTKKKKKKWYRQLLKKLAHHLFPLISHLVHLLIYGWFQTLSCHWYGLEHLRSLHRKGQPVIYAFWHQRMLFFVYSHRRRRVCVLVSSHRDGELITQIIHTFGFQTARGSSTRGGVRGFLELLQHARQSVDLAVTPDGPRGPLYRVKDGVIQLASKTGFPIVAGAYGASHVWHLPSWDRFLIPKPWSHIAVVVAPPLTVPPHLSAKERKEYCRYLENILREVTQKADNLAQTRLPKGWRGKTYTVE